jgi:plasmid maintenance system antidote protein VapI
MITEDLKDYLSDRGIKQKWLAEQIDVSESYISRMLSGSRNIPFWMQYRIETALNIKIGEPNE